MDSILSFKKLPARDIKVRSSLFLLSAICGLTVILFSSNIIYANATANFNQSSIDSSISNSQQEEVQDTTQLTRQPGAINQQPGAINQQPGTVLDDTGPTTQPETSTNFECDTSGSNQQCYCRGNADCFDMGRAGVCSGTLVPHPAGGSGTYKCTRSQ